MTTTRLCGGAELALQNMHLTLTEEQTVRSTVQKYAYPQSCCKLVCWIVYRIVQAIKSLFGRSDWQAAEKLIKNRWLCIVIERGVVQQNPQNGLEETIKDRCIHKVFPQISTELLDLTVLCQEKTTDAEGIRNSMQKLDFISLMNNLQSRLAPIRNSIEPHADLQSRLDALFANCIRDDEARISSPAA
jgi:hypothetical protein